MKIRYLDAADAEFQEAIDYYNKQRPELGFEFSDDAVLGQPFPQRSLRALRLFSSVYSDQIRSGHRRRQNQ
jgi:hypothetical protein